MIQTVDQTLNGFLRERERLNDVKDGLTRVMFIDDSIILEWR